MMKKRETYETVLRTPKKITFLILVLAQLSAFSDVYSQENIFKAGASISNITPNLESGIVGNFGTPPPAKHIHDQLSARSLVLNDGTNTLVFVICDNVSINREIFDAAKQRLQEKTKIPSSYMLMAATHTHSGTSAGGEGDKRRGWHPNDPLDSYQQYLVNRIVDGVQVAINNMEPAVIGWGSVNAPEHVFNRRWVMKKPVKNPFGELDPVQMNPGIGNPNLAEPSGPTDPEVSFISVQSKSGRPLALLANYSLHYVGGLPNDHISADYFAVFADRVQALLQADRQDPPFVGIMSNGTSGDINNIDVKGSSQKLPPYQKMNLVAKDLAERVYKATPSIKYHNWVPIKGLQSEIALQVRKPNEKLLAWANQIVSRPDSIKPGHPLEKTYAQRTLQIREWPDQINIILQAFKIGDLGIAAIPFETFAETGLEIKAKSPFKPSFTIELANGGYGYLPTPRQHDRGGYETWLGTNRVEKEASEKIVKELLSLFSKLK